MKDTKNKIVNNILKTSRKFFRRAYFRDTLKWYSTIDTDGRISKSNDISFVKNKIPLKKFIKSTYEFKSISYVIKNISKRCKPTYIMLPHYNDGDTQQCMTETGKVTILEYPEGINISFESERAIALRGLQEELSLNVSSFSLRYERRVGKFAIYSLNLDRATFLTQIHNELYLTSINNFTKIIRRDSTTRKVAVIVYGSLMSIIKHMSRFKDRNVETNDGIIGFDIMDIKVYCKVLN